MLNNSTTLAEYLDQLDEPRSSEINQLHKLIVKCAPKLKPDIQSDGIGYGKYHYKYASGREGDSWVVALSSRKNYISLYVSCATKQGYLAESYKSKLPKANIGKSCIRFRHLSDVDLDVVAEILNEAEKLGGMEQVNE